MARQIEICRLFLTEMWAEKKCVGVYASDVMTAAATTTLKQSLAMQGGGALEADF